VAEPNQRQRDDPRDVDRVAAFDGDGRAQRLDP